SRVVWLACFVFSSRRRHTRLSRDWSSDVCSSDLGQLASGELAQAEDREIIDVTDLLDRVARENMRTAGSAAILVEADDSLGTIRSEERRVGKEYRCHDTPQRSREW